MPDSVLATGNFYKNTPTNCANIQEVKEGEVVGGGRERGHSHQ